MSEASQSEQESKSGSDGDGSEGSAAVITTGIAGQAFVPNARRRSSLGTVEDEDEAESIDEGSDVEVLNDEEKQPAGDKVERIRLPTRIRNMYLFLELIHDSEDGRRVYLCEEPACDGDVAAKAKFARSGVQQAAKRKDAGHFADLSYTISRRCILKVWQKGSRPEDEEEEWLGMQLRLLQMERHPNILLPRRIIEDELAFYVEFDAVLVGTSLLTMMINDESLTETQVQSIVRGVLRGLHHLHRHGLAHRDIKPENVLLEWKRKDVRGALHRYSKVPTCWRSTKSGIKAWLPAAKFKNSLARHMLRSYVRIIDLDTVSDGTSKVICGTPGCMAPEAYLGYAGPSGDLFALGVLLYMLVTCEAPLHDATYRWLGYKRLEELSETSRQRIAEATVQLLNELNWNQKTWECLIMCCHLCRSLMSASTELRPSDADDLLTTAPWFHKAVQPADIMTSEEIQRLRNIQIWNDNAADDDDDQEVEIDASGIAQPPRRDITARRGAVSMPCESAEDGSSQHSYQHSDLGD